MGRRLLQLLGGVVVSVGLVAMLGNTLWVTHPEQVYNSIPVHSIFHCETQSLQHQHETNSSIFIQQNQVPTSYASRHSIVVWFYCCSSFQVGKGLRNPLTPHNRNNNHAAKPFSITQFVGYHADRLVESLTTTGVIAMMGLSILGGEARRVAKRIVFKFYGILSRSQTSTEASYRKLSIWVPPFSTLAPISLI